MESLLWFLLEAGAALAALIFIVWWTWPKGKSDDTEAKTPPERE
jgi:Na+-driven multidrug efflux pump